MQTLLKRREFLGATAAWLSTSLVTRNVDTTSSLEFDLSLAETSLSKSLRNGQIKHLDLAAVAKTKYGLQAVEYASEFFPEGQPADAELVDEMNTRAADHGVRQLLIVVNRETRIAEADNTAGRRAMQSIQRWIDCASALGCHSLQINPTGSGDPEHYRQRVIDRLGQICDYASLRRINLLLGNYGDVVVSAKWITSVIEAVDSNCCRTIPTIRSLRKDEEFDALIEMVPLAKAMTVEALQFNEDGEETSCDMRRAIHAVHDAGYRGYVGVNYRGDERDEDSGIRSTIQLLNRIRSESDR